MGLGHLGIDSLGAWVLFERMPMHMKVSDAVEANSRNPGVEEIVSKRISEMGSKGILSYNIGDLYEDAEIQFADELARDEVGLNHE